MNEMVEEFLEELVKEGAINNYRQAFISESKSTNSTYYNILATDNTDSYLMTVRVSDHGYDGYSAKHDAYISVSNWNKPTEPIEKGATYIEERYFRKGIVALSNAYYTTVVYSDGEMRNYPTEYAKWGIEK